MSVFSRTEQMLLLGHTTEEIEILLIHDENEELHAFVTDGSGFCIECGDTEEGLMHNNTWRNVEPLMDLDKCAEGCVCPPEDRWQGE